MKKQISILLSILLILISFVSCDNPFFIKAVKLYEVSYSTNGGSPIESSRTDCLKTLPYTSKTDHNFVGWYLTSDFTGDPVSFPLVITQDTTLYARWQQQFTVTFECNGGDEIDTFKTGVLETPPDTSKKNYKFDGWFTTSYFSGEAITFPFVITKPTVLYAKWTATFEVSFVTNGGTELSSFRTSEIEEAPETTYEGCSFVGWFTDKELTKAVEFPLTLTKDIVLYAKWQQNYNVTFVTNGGTSIEALFTGYISEEPETTKNDFSFGGWYLDSDLSEGNKVTFPYTVPNDITLYAKWKAAQCTVTYMSNDATGGTVPESVTVDKGSTYTVLGNTGNLEKSGFAFTKWNTKADGEGQGYSAGNTLTVTGDITLYAQWGKDYAAMITVPGGWFYLGAPSTSSRPKIILSSFQIAQYELTYELWLEVYTWAKDHGYNLSSASKGYAANDKYKSFVPATNISWEMACVWLNAYSEYKGYDPVYYKDSTVWKNDTNTSGTVTWYINKNGFRLPTECEWEFAAGGGDSENHDNYIYSGSNTIGDVAWYSGNSVKETSPVGTKKANTLEIYDMTGNVQEWCFDGYSSFGSGELTNPFHYSSGSDKCLRGGSFSDITSSNNKSKLNITYRCYAHQKSYSVGNSSYECYNLSEIGIRLARNAE